MIIIVLIVLATIGVFGKKFLAVDSCLDSGGHWDYERGECVNLERGTAVDECLSSGGQWDFEENVCRKPENNK